MEKNNLLRDYWREITFVDSKLQKAENGMQKLRKEKHNLMIKFFRETMKQLESSSIKK